MLQTNVKPRVVLVGKTNVGKSTLFNRLANKKISIAHSTPGATRDCITRDALIGGLQVTLVDSGGIDSALEEDKPFQPLVFERVKTYLDQKADLVLFVTSAKEGLGPQDHEVAAVIRQCQKPVIPVINKVDHETHAPHAYDLTRLGFSDPCLVSAAQNSGLEDLRQRIAEALHSTCGDFSISSGLKLIESESECEDVSSPINIAIVGKPNSGKSTLVNALLCEDRVMTSSMPGTTIDAVDTYLTYAQHDICLIDTAGIRRQRSVDSEIEKMAIARTLCAIDRASVVILLINADEGVTEQDLKIAGFVVEKKKACVIAINKWDETVKKERTQDDFIEEVRFHMPFLAFAPIIFISGKYGDKIFVAIEKALKLAKRFNSRINTSKLNRSLERAVEAHPPPVVACRRLRFYFIAQADSAPPTFTISCSKPHEVHFSYERYLANHFRRDLDLDEIPLRLVFKRKSTGSNPAA